VNNGLKYACTHPMQVQNSINEDISNFLSQKLTHMAHTILTKNGAKVWNIIIVPKPYSGSLIWLQSQITDYIITRH